MVKACRQNEGIPASGVVVSSSGAHRLEKSSPQDLEPVASGQWQGGSPAERTDGQQGCRPEFGLHSARLRNGTGVTSQCAPGMDCQRRQRPGETGS